MLGNKLVAVVVAANKQTDVQDILSVCTRTMPKYKMPQTMLLAPSLPKKISGKIDKNACMELIAKENSNDAAQHKKNNKGSDHEQH